MRIAWLRLVLAAFLAVVAGSHEARACGVCVEDKIAATYDHAVVTGAARRHHVVVFAAIEGRAAPGAAETVRRAAARVAGVQPESIRTSEEPRALSFALDPRVIAPRRALDRMERVARPAGLRLVLLRVM